MDETPQQPQAPAAPQQKPKISFEPKIILAVVVVIAIIGAVVFFWPQIFKSEQQKPVEETVKALPEIQAYAASHPQATISVSLVPQGQFISEIVSVKKYCSQIIFGSYYKASAVDSESGETFIAWVDTKDLKYVCSTIIVPATSTTSALQTTTTAGSATTLAETSTTAGSATTISGSTTTTAAGNNTTTTTGAGGSTTTSAGATTTTSVGGTTTTTIALTTTTVPPTTSSSTTSSTTTTIPIKTFGPTDCSGSATSAALLNNYKGVSKFTLPGAGAISKLTIYVVGASSSSSQQVMKGVIYAADGSGGDPGSWKGTTGETAVAKDQSVGWVDLTFSSPINLAAGDYWLGIITGNSFGIIRFHYTSTGITKSITDTYSDGASNPFGTPPNSGDVQICVYATYT